MCNCLFILTKVDTERPKQKLKADRAEKNQGLDGVIREPRQPEDTERKLVGANHPHLVAHLLVI